MLGLFISSLSSGVNPQYTPLVAEGGQSNMEGVGDISQLPANLQQPITGAYIWQPGTADFGVLEAGVNNLGSSATTYGPEILTAKTMVDSLGEVYIAKRAVSGSSLEEEAGRNDWDLATNELYPQWVAYINDCISYMKSQGKTPIVIVNWSQGERDSKFETAANAYEANLTAMYDQLKIDINAPIAGFVHSRVHNSISRTGYPYLDTVRTAQENVATNYPATLINKDDMTHNADNLHEDGTETGQQLLGTRFGQANITLFNNYQ